MLIFQLEIYSNFKRKQFFNISYKKYIFRITCLCSSTNCIQSEYIIYNTDMRVTFNEKRIKYILALNNGYMNLLI